MAIADMTVCANMRLGRGRMLRLTCGHRLEPLGHLLAGLIQDQHELLADPEVVIVDERRRGAAVPRTPLPAR